MLWALSTIYFIMTWRWLWATQTWHVQIQSTISNSPYSNPYAALDEIHYMCSVTFTLCGAWKMTILQKSIRHLLTSRDCNTMKPCAYWIPADKLYPHDMLLRSSRNDHRWNELWALCLATYIQQSTPSIKSVYSMPTCCLRELLGACRHNGLMVFMLPV